MQVAVMLAAPWREPAEVVPAFAEEPWTLAFLSGGGGSRARWSYLARDPDAVLRLEPDDPRDPFAELKTLLGAPMATLADGPPFQGGVAGLASYELGDRVERLGLARAADWPDLAAARYPAILAFDHEAGRVLALGRGADAAEAEARAWRALGWLETPPRDGWRGRLCEGLEAGDGAAYEAAVSEVVDRIAAGEFFQANIARTWRGRLTAGATPGDLLDRLVRQSAAPFAAYLRLPGAAVVSNSPRGSWRPAPRTGRRT